MTSAAEDDEILAHRFITKEESLLTTLKSFVAYSNAVKSSQPLDEWCATHHFAFRRFILVCARCSVPAQQTFLRELGTYEHSIARLPLVQDTNARENSRYEAAQSQIGLSCICFDSR